MKTTLSVELQKARALRGRLAETAAECQQRLATVGDRSPRLCLRIYDCEGDCAPVPVLLHGETRIGLSMRMRVATHERAETIAIVRCDAAEPVSCHWHREAERVLVLKGRLDEETDGRSYYPGDWYYAGATQHHSPTLIPGSLLAVYWSPGLPDWDDELFMQTADGASE